MSIQIQYFQYKVLPERLRTFTFAVHKMLDLFTHFHRVCCALKLTGEPMVSLFNSCIVGRFIHFVAPVQPTTLVAPQIVQPPRNMIVLESKPVTFTARIKGTPSKSINKVDHFTAFIYYQRSAKNTLN